LLLVAGYKCIAGFTDEVKNLVIVGLGAIIGVWHFAVLAGIEYV
jgi:hypothetical protein